jgi:hypothetical protein
MEDSWSAPRSCFPPEVLSRHGPPLLRWVRVPSPFPTITARMRPSDSPAASARLRFILGHAYLSGSGRQRRPPQGSVAIPAVSHRASVRLPSLPFRRSPRDARSRRVRWRFRPFPAGPQSDSHSPRFRVPLLPGRSGASQVTGPSSSVVPRSTTPPVPSRLALSPRGVLPSGSLNPWASGSMCFEAAFPRPVRSPDYASTAPLRRTAASLATSLPATL